MNKLDVLAILINIFISMIYIGGVGLLFKEQFKNYYLKVKMRRRLQARRNAMKEKNWLEVHLGQILAVALKRPIQPQTFIKLETGTFFLILFMGLKNVSLAAALMMALLITALPYLLLRLRLEVWRRKGSHEGEKLISELLSQYRICNFNIYRAIERVIEQKRDTKISNVLLFKLLMNIRNTGSKEVIRSATDSFAYGINTNWSRMLANNIRIAAETGMNVSLSIEDILIQLREARTLVEERKRMNSEAARMVVFFIPFIYIGTAFMATRYLDIAPEQFFKNQLYTTQGFFLLTVILFLFLVNLAILEVVNNQKFDY